MNIRTDYLALILTIQKNQKDKNINLAEVVL